MIEEASDTSTVRESLDKVWQSIFGDMESKITDKIITRISQGINLPGGKKSELKLKIYDALRFLLTTSRASDVHKGLISYRHRACSLWETLNAFNINGERQLEGLIASTPFTLEKTTQNALLTAVEEQAEEDRGYPDIYPPSFFEVEGQRITLWGGDIRLSRIRRDLEWLISCIDRAIKTNEPLIKKPKEGQDGLGKANSDHIESFVMALCNVYYQVTNNVPNVSWSGKNKIPKGKVITLVDHCLKALEKGRSERWIADIIQANIKKFKEGGQVTPPPLWIEK